MIIFKICVNNWLLWPINKPPFIYLNFEKWQTINESCRWYWSIKKEFLTIFRRMWTNFVYIILLHGSAWESNIKYDLDYSDVIEVVGRAYYGAYYQHKYYFKFGAP